MSRRDQIQMSEEEIAAFLAANRTVHVATLARDGTPHLTTLWYGLLDGRIVAWTYRKSQKIKNLERDPRITALVESGDTYSSLQGVQIVGRAEMADDPDAVMQVAEAVYVRNADRFGDVEFQGDRVADAGRRDTLRAMSEKRIAITVEPVHVVSWDHRKLGGVY